MEQTNFWMAECLAWVERRAYRLISILDETDLDARPKFAAGLRMLTEAQADVLVVYAPDHLPGDWVPRIEVAGDGSDPFAIPPENRPQRAPRQRRGRTIRRPE